MLILCSQPKRRRKSIDNVEDFANFSFFDVFSTEDRIRKHVCTLYYAFVKTANTLYVNS